MQHQGVPTAIPVAHPTRYSTSNASGAQQPMHKPPHATRNPGHHHPRPNGPDPLMAIQTRLPTPQRPDNRCQPSLGHGHTAVTCRSKDSLCYKCSQYGNLAHACLSAKETCLGGVGLNMNSGGHTHTKSAMINPRIQRLKYPSLPPTP